MDKPEEYYQSNEYKEYVLKRTCTSKKTFYNRNDARKNAKMVGKRVHDSKLRAYKCHFCDNFHIGHTKYESRNYYAHARVQTGGASRI